VTRIAPWHAKKPAGFAAGTADSSVGPNTVGSRERVYHDRAECPVGRAVPMDNRADGTGGAELCPVCRSLPG
jgi:hypothetical protein